MRLVALTLLALVGLAMATPPPFVKLMARSWDGSSQPTGKRGTAGVFAEHLTLMSDAKGTLTGSARRRAMIFDMTYEATFKVTVAIDPKRANTISVTLADPSGDELPEGQKWCGWTGSLALRPAKKPNTYYLEGTATDCNRKPLTLFYE